ncbi:unnamed protein product [Mucor hiemalis]
MHIRCDKSRSHESHPKSISTSRIPWYFNQLSKECTNSTATTGVPGFRIQYKDYEIFSSSKEAYQTYEQSQASVEPAEQTLQLQMVCKYDGKNDIDDPGNRRSLTTSSTHAARFSEKFTPLPPKLECTDEVVSRKHEGIGIVKSW